MQTDDARATLLARFLAKVNTGDQHSPGGCWAWMGTRVGGKGLLYGGLRVRGRQFKAHRIAVEVARGAIPQGMVIDHLCRNTACVNPAHLEVVTDRVNILRGVGAAAIHAAQTHCLRGHLLAGENLAPCRKGFRRCIACANLRVRPTWAQRKAATAKRAAKGV